VERIRVRPEAGELQGYSGNAAAEGWGVAYRCGDVYSASVETYCRGGEVVGFTCPVCGIWVFPYAWHICWKDIMTVEAWFGKMLEEYKDDIEFVREGERFYKEEMLALESKIERLTRALEKIIVTSQCMSMSTEWATSIAKEALKKKEEVK